MVAAQQVTAPEVQESVIRRAIRLLLSESEAAYRCERDFHHHFSACLNSVSPLRLGTRKALVSFEHPSCAAYGSGRSGNLDLYFREEHG